MARLVEKGVLNSFGAFLFLQEKANETIKDMIDGGRLEPEEGRRFLEDLADRFDDDSETIRKRFQESIAGGMREAGVATETDLKELKARLAKIEGQLENLSERITE